MADVGYLAIVVAGLGAYWWRHLRARPRETSNELFEPDAEVALHVAVHEATSRHQRVSSLHVLYGLLQDELVTAAISTAGGDADAIEDRVLAALGELPDDDDDHAGAIARRAATLARFGGRRASCTDLWAALGRSPAGRLLDDHPLDRGATLFALFHGGRAPDLSQLDGRDVLIVLRNDHYSTQEFVCSLLREVFALPESEATALMLATHTTGRAVIGRFSAAAARDKIAQVRARARAEAFPLWIGIEPA